MLTSASTCFCASSEPMAIVPFIYTLPHAISVGLLASQDLYGTLQNLEPGSRVNCAHLLPSNLCYNQCCCSSVQLYVTILGLYRDNGKENGSCCSILGLYLSPFIQIALTSLLQAKAMPSNLKPNQNHEPRLPTRCSQWLPASSS